MAAVAKWIASTTQPGRRTGPTTPTTGWGGRTARATLVLWVALVLPSAGAVPAEATRSPVRPAVDHPAGRPAAARSGPVFRWPVAGPGRPVRPFDPPPRPWLAGHRGVDLAAEPGAVVRAAGAGTVLFAGQVAGRPVVTVGHTDGLRTTYEPVRPGLPVGTPVTAGTPLGLLLAGHPGCPVTACLHWGLRHGGTYLDPLALLGPVPVRLLPVGPAPAPAG